MQNLQNYPIPQHNLMYNALHMLSTINNPTGFTPAFNMNLISNYNSLSKFQNLSDISKMSNLTSINKLLTSNNVIYILNLILFN